MTLRLLTLPVSTNHLYRRGKGRGIYMDERAERCKEAIGWEARSQYRGKPLAGALAVCVALYWPDRRKHDIDNSFHASFSRVSVVAQASPRSRLSFPDSSMESTASEIAVGNRPASYRGWASS
jgi:hypothetical protein